MDKKFIPSTSFLLDRIRHGGVEWKDGKFLLLGMQASIGAYFSTVFLQRFLEKEIGHKNAMRILYSHGKFQAKEGVRIFNNRFGLTRSRADIEKGLSTHIGQFQFLGLGLFEWVTKDINKKRFLIKGASTTAEEYLSYFPTERKFIDHFHRGLMAGFVEEVMGEEFYCIEERCVARGNKCCTFSVRKRGDFDPKSNEFVGQDFGNEEDLLSSLEPKREPLF